MKVKFLACPEQQKRLLLLEPQKQKQTKGQMKNKTRIVIFTNFGHMPCKT